VAWVVEVNDLGVSDSEAGRPGHPALLNLSPNPFNSMLTIWYETGSAARPTRLTIHDITGREVFSAFTTPSVTGGKITPPTPPAIAGGDSQTLVWDASAVPAGVYFVRLQTGREAVTKKVVLMR